MHNFSVCKLDIFLRDALNTFPNSVQLKCQLDSKAEFSEAKLYILPALGSSQETAVTPVINNQCSLAY